MARIELLYEADASPAITRDKAVNALQTLLSQLHWPLWMLTEHFLSTENDQTVQIEGLEFDPQKVEFQISEDEEVATGRYVLNVRVLRDGTTYTLEDRWKELGKPINRHVPEPAYFCAWGGFLPLLYYGSDTSTAWEQPEVAYVLIRYDYLEARGSETKGFGVKPPDPQRDVQILDVWDAMRNRDAVLFSDYPPMSLQEPLRLA